MSVDQTKTVDFISTAKSGRVTLTISDHLKWGTDDHLFLSQEKLNSYLRFIESGEICDEYPKAIGQEIAISVVCKFPPDAAGIDFLNSAKTTIEHAGFVLEYSTFSET
ncbi:MAG TPA: DUF6572 domain-containing protein [Pyrinomonadaceae bacterium]|nr:DUF6572 domain-containing protein [Pyrinomonadaceae bacterium]